MAISENTKKYAPRDTALRSNRKRTLRVGVMPEREYRERVLKIARGEYRPKRDEPKVWFASLQTLAQVLNRKNIELLKIIVERNPNSIVELAEYSGRQQSNLSRSLSTLANYQLIDLQKVGRRIRPVARYDEIDACISLS